MFDKTFIVRPYNSSAIRQLARSNERMSDTIRDTSANEIKSRDRVDISLEEYESMKKELKELRSFKSYVTGLFIKIDGSLIQILENYAIDNIKAYWVDDVSGMKRIFSVAFSVNKEDLRKVNK